MSGGLLSLVSGSSGKDYLVDLDLNRKTLDGILQVIRDAPLLEICSLSFISPPNDDCRIPEIIIRHPYLRTLQLFFIEETEVFQKTLTHWNFHPWSRGRSNWSNWRRAWWST